MFERVSRQVESSPCCDWGTPSSAYAPHARTGTMFGPVEFGDFTLAGLQVGLAQRNPTSHATRTSRGFSNGSKPTESHFPNSSKKSSRRT